MNHQQQKRRKEHEITINIIGWMVNVQTKSQIIQKRKILEKRKKNEES